MAPWEFVLTVFSGYLGLLIGYKILDRVWENRRRERRVKLWTEMVLEKRRTKKDWHSQTFRKDD